MKNNYIQCSFWKKHYESYLDVEKDINLELKKLQNDKHKIIDVSISSGTLNLDNFLYTYTITILYR